MGGLVLFGFSNIAADDEHGCGVNISDVPTGTATVVSREEEEKQLQKKVAQYISHTPYLDDLLTVLGLWVQLTRHVMAIQKYQAKIEASLVQ